MFEKEAEELFKKKPLGYEMKLELEIYTDGFNDGYQKANEWHSLRKNPNDLPKEKVDVFILYSWKEVDVKHLEWNKEWWGNGTHCSLTDVTHWKEIVLPKEFMR